MPRAARSTSLPTKKSHGAPARRSSAAAPKRPPEPARAFTQPRARATYQALLEGARDVFSERGYDAAQTPEIAARAGVSVGTFYRYFDDKRQALIEMMRGHLDESSARVLGELAPQRFAGGDHRAVFDAAIEALFTEARRFPALERVMQEMALRDPEIAALRDRFEATSEQALAALVGQFTSRAEIPDPLAAAHVILRAGLLIALSEAGAVGAVAGGQRRVGERAVKLALREMLHRYLFPSAGSSMTKVTRSPSSAKTRPPWASTARRQK